MKRMLSVICVLAAAAPLAANAIAADLKATDISGRWQGTTWVRETGGNLTLDVVACGTGWCGIKVAADASCGGTALKLDGGAAEGDNILFKARWSWRLGPLLTSCRAT
jgi:hypothetical protein